MTARARALPGTRIYVASSWRNGFQPMVVEELRVLGHELYDFRNPKEHAHERDQGFHWYDIDSRWESWSPEKFRSSLQHPLAKAGFKSDFEALKWADFVLLVMPCGRSAHLELGWASGAGKGTGILLSDGEPELMYSLAHHLFVGIDEMKDFFS